MISDQGSYYHDQGSYLRAQGSYHHATISASTLWCLKKENNQASRSMCIISLGVVNGDVFGHSPLLKVVDDVLMGTEVSRVYYHATRYVYYMQRCGIMYFFLSKI